MYFDSREHGITGWNWSLDFCSSATDEFIAQTVKTSLHNSFGTTKIITIGIKKNNKKRSNLVMVP